MRILFQGDSITDADRTRLRRDDYLGNGYALFVKAALGYECPDFEFYNRGESGNQIVNLYARI